MKKENFKKPFKLKNKIKNYEWGSEGESAYIPQLLGIEPESNTAYAELWIGAHPDASSELKLDSEEMTLEEAITNYPREILGKEIARKYKNTLPFLFKVLSAKESLSIQTHPDKTTAEKLHSEDPQHYPDKNHKPEIAIALDSLQALVGFRPIMEIFQALNRYTELASFIGRDKVSQLMEAMKNSIDTSEILNDVFYSLMKKAISYPNELEKLCEKLAKKFEKNLERNSSKDKRREKLFLKLREKYNTDVGLLVIFFLNLVELKKGEAVFLDAGVLHAYLKGNIVECMANSDNVVRAGLTPKHKDIETLVDITKYQAGEVKILNSDNKNKKQVDYPISVDEFQISRYQLEKGEKIDIGPIDSVEILLLIDGDLSTKSVDEKLTVSKGEAILIPAAMEKYTVKSKEKSYFFRVKVPK